MKLSDWAKSQGIHYTTAWRMWRSGKLPHPARQLATGTILIDCTDKTEPILTGQELRVPDTAKH